MAKVECSWCHNKEVEEEDSHVVHFFGRDFVVCEQDFQLLWRGFAGIGEFIRQFKTAMAVRK